MSKAADRAVGVLTWVLTVGLFLGWAGAMGSLLIRGSILQQLLHPNTSDAWTDFDASFNPKNPNGPWKYGWSDGLTTTVYPYLQLMEIPNAGGRGYRWLNPAPSANPPSQSGPVPGDSNDSFLTFADGAVGLHPGGTSGHAYAHLVWTAPKPGQYLVATRFAGQYGTPDADIHVTVNGKEVFNGTLEAVGLGKPYNGLHQLEAGQTVDFAVGPNNAYEGKAPGIGDVAVQAQVQKQ